MNKLGDNVRCVDGKYEYSYTSRRKLANKVDELEIIHIKEEELRFMLEVIKAVKVQHKVEKAKV